jgi:hypothetical protein
VRGLAAVFTREIQERRLLLLMALLLGFVPLILPLVPGLDSGDAGELRQATAVGLMLIASLTLALLLGAMGIAGDLMAGRMGFYFSRPLPAWAIWAGKLAAMLALVLAAAVLVLLPTLLVDGFSGNLELVPVASTLLPWALALLLLLLLGSHFLAISIRGRSPWLVLDLAGLLATAGVAISVWRTCLIEGGTPFALGRSPFVVDPTFLGWPLLAGLLLALVLGLLLATALQVGWGRIDPRRGHRVQSLFFWSLATLALAGLVGASRWVFAATPEDLFKVLLVQPAPRGPWLAVQGSVRQRPGFYPVLLMDPAGGRFARARAALSVYGVPEVSFSEDGRLAYWFERQDPAGSQVELKTLDLSGPSPRPRATGAVFSWRPTSVRPAFLLSPDGRRLAVFDQERLTVEDLATHKLLVARELDEPPSYLQSSTLQFDGADRLRLDLLSRNRRGGRVGRSPWLSAEQAGDPARTRVSMVEADLTTGRVGAVGSVGSTLDGAAWERSPDGERGVVFNYSALEVHDGRSGERLSTIPGRPLFTGFVPGGLLVSRFSSVGREVLLFDRDGRQERARLSLPRASLVSIQGGLTGASLQLFARSERGGYPRGGHGTGGTVVWQRWRIDVERGAFESLPERRLYLLGPGALWSPEAMRRADGVAGLRPSGEVAGIFVHPGR